MLKITLRNRLRECTLVLGLLLFLFTVVSVMAPRSVAYASSLAEDYSAGSTLAPGMLVSTDKNNGSAIELATIDNSNLLFGVVQAKGSGLINFTHAGTNVGVATTGVADTYVSDINGGIKKGDYIGPSWIDGIGMKVIEGDPHKVLGVALEDFNVADAHEFTDIKTSDGTKTAKIGSISVRLSAPPSKQLVANSSGVSGFAAKLVGREVSFVRAVAGSLMFLVALILASLFVRTSIRNSFISLGRNPLASKTIYKSLFQVSVVSMIIILSGAAAAYAVVLV